MKLCMFHPEGHPMERGWVGRIDGDRVVHLAAQTLQSFFTGGGSAREHAEYALGEVCLLAPVLHPPAIRVFEEQRSFAFANPAAILGHGAEIRAPAASPRDTVSRGSLAVAPRVAALMGADGAIAAFTILAEWRDPSGRPPKDRDFALGLGPVAATAGTFEPEGCVSVVRAGGSERLRQVAAAFDWHAAVSFAAQGTRLYPGDLLCGPSCGVVEGLAVGTSVEVEVEGIGVLEQRVAG